MLSCPRHETQKRSSITPAASLLFEKSGMPFSKSSTTPSTTREHITLARVKALSPTCAIPDVLYHGGSLGIIDCKMAGYVPRGWTRTRFCILGGFDLHGTGDERVDWQRRV
ncbi:hypothetical protein BD289DRAFT_444559 [Coniella lustricola]|uniref:Uncharacterized protein n=1 Tax=Coniella lustricola TaxID=2025994 RepID=A0A2T2ZVQ5_9PEZI|nr:hypothetical protein BD289DRAFT_444559 [Coniella lustricola]